MTSPVVSVLVTCYNLGQYLDEAIDSVMAQTFQDFEILIVDDGSTDPSTVRLLAEYRRPRTRVFGIDNRGLPGARNEAARHATGRYLCALDADDLLHHQWFEKAIRVLEDDRSLTFVSHWLRAFGAETWDWTPERCDVESLLTRNTVNGAALVRREAFESIGGYDESMTHGCEDWDLWLTMVERGYRGTIIPEVLFFYRRRLESMSQVMLRGETHLQLVERLIRKHEASFRQHLPELVMDKETAIQRVRRELHNLQIEDETWLTPTATRAREQLQFLRDKVERVNESQRVESVLARFEERSQHLALMEADRDRFRAAFEEVQRELDLVRGDRDRLKAAWTSGQAECDRLRSAAAASEHELQQLNATHAELQAHREQLLTALTAMRNSLSWKLSAPVRTAVGWIRSGGK
jgi:GT2 family glycosyltransferase